LRQSQKASGHLNRSWSSYKAILQIEMRIKRNLTRFIYSTDASRGSIGSTDLKMLVQMQKSVVQ
jgi:hypothetical protein